MRYKLFGKSGLQVSELCLGTMTFGEDWGWGASKAVSRQIFDTFAEAGGNFIDTANNYTDGSAENFVGEFTSADRDHFVIATKYTLNKRRDDPNAGGNGRKNMMQAVEASLKRLKTDYIDLYWLHVWDFTTPVEEVLRAFDDLVRAGKVLYIGISDTPAWIVSYATAIAELRGWSRFVGLQVPYSLSNRHVERDLLPMGKQLDIAVTTWGMLAGGGLTGKYNTDSDDPKRYAGVEDRVKGMATEVARITDELGRPPSQVAINWIRQQQNRAQIIPIIGARTLEQIEGNLGVLEFELSDEHLASLDELSAIDYGFPHTFVASDNVMQLIHGDTFSQLDNHRR